MITIDDGDDDELPPASTKAKLRGLFAAFFAILVLALVMSITAIVYLAYGARVQTEYNSEQLEQIEKINKRLIDCTDPDGRCYQRGQKQTSQVVGNINEVSILAATCADQDGPQSVVEIRNCIVRGLEGDNK